MAEKPFMKNRIHGLLARVWSPSSDADLYRMRQASRPTEENRTWAAVVLCGSLLCVVLSFMLYMAWSRQDTETYLKSREGIAFLNDGADGLAPVSWQASPLSFDGCDMSATCRESLAGLLDGSGRSLSMIPDVIPEGRPAPAPVYRLYRLRVAASTLTPMSHLETVIITLPAFQYRRAELWLDGHHRQARIDSETLSTPVEIRRITGGFVEVDLLVEADGDQRELVIADRPGANRLERSVALMSRTEYDDYVEFSASDRAGRGNWIGMIARIALAVFALALFLIIDSSPESLGLALFFGFEGVAMSFRYTWLPIENPTFITHFCYQMGDIFRLYFFLQISRLVGKGLLPWLVIGTLLSIPYGFARHYGDALAWGWPKQIPNWRDMIVGSVGAVACLRTAWFLRRRKLPWRLAALGVAAVGGLEQALDPVLSFFPTIHQSVIATTVIDLLQPASAWLLAFACFFNISTLESRVKGLSAELAKSAVMRSEMELGQAMQRAFLTMPALPSACRMAHHHEPMLYVSGDTFFVYSSDDGTQVTAVINDVTGHGVQAALKASAVSVIAKALWESRTPTGPSGGKLLEYDRQLSEFLRQMSDEPDLSTMSGAELDLQTGVVTFYRANFPLPVVVERLMPAENPPGSGDVLASPEAFSSWRPAVIPVANRTLASYQLTPGSMIILGSDGFFDTSRRVTDFVKHLRSYLSAKDEGLGPEVLKDSILRSGLFPDAATADDRTILVLQWRGPADKAA